MDINVNNQAPVTQLDPDAMLGLIEGFPEQCRRAFEIAKATDPPTPEILPGVIALAGMGGSASGGDIVKALFEAHGGAAFVVIRDYQWPNYIGVGDVVFCVSYSGNTEETLAIYQEAKKSGARVVAVTSGGKLKEMATEDGFTVYEVPGGQPPRTAWGYLTIPVIVACHQMKVLPEQPIEASISLLESCVAEWGPGSADAAPKALAEELSGALPVIYGLGTWQGYVANRWRSQINENAKQLAISNSYPELNHNEVVGWIGASKQGIGKVVGVLLKDGTESDRMKTRASTTEKLVPVHFHHVAAKGDSLLERILSLTLFGDYMSYYLARMNGVDPMDISSIDKIKVALAELK